MTAYRLLGLGQDDPGLLRRFDVGFVGRAAELAMFDAALGRVAGGHGTQCVLVHGEAGLGKTRLVREWLDRTGGPAALRGAGRCRPYGEQGSLRPLADAVASLLPEAANDPHTLCDAAGLADSADRVSMAEAVAVLSDGLLLDGTPNPSLDETCAALVRVLTALSRRRPVVLVIDDCHWAGPLLLDALDRLTGELGRAAVLLVCLARPELLDTRPAWASGSYAVRPMPLSGLSHEDLAVLAAELVEVGAHWDAVGTRLLERAEGNPLHLEQLLAMVSETGTQDALPPTVQSLLGARIDALDPDERMVLDLASVIGREFGADELAELAGGGIAGDDLVRAALPRLSGRRLVEPADRSGPGHISFRFTNGLVQEVAYQSMSKRARAERHERAAELPSVQAGGEGAVGGHLEQAHRCRAELGLLDERTEGLRRRAARALSGAGAQALARSDLPWAGDLLTRALTLYGPDEPSRTPAARRLGEVQLALGHPDEARSLLGDVLAAPANPVEAAHARLALAAVDPQARAGSPAETARAALPVFEAAHDELGQARACLRMAQQRQSQGRHGEADRLLTRAIAHAVHADGEPERAAALGAVGISLWRGPEPVAEAVARCRGLLAEHGRERRTVRMTLNCPLAVLLALQDRQDAARDCLVEAGQLADELGYAEAQVFIPVFTAMVETLAGNQQQAIGLLEAAADAARRTGAVTLSRTVTVESARLLLDTGQQDAALDMLGPQRRGPVSHSPTRSTWTACTAESPLPRDAPTRLCCWPRARSTRRH